MKLSILITLIVAVLTGCASSEMDPQELQKRKAELLERCKKLKKDVEDLKGQPLRRNAAIEYYQSECVARTDPAFYES